MINEVRFGSDSEDESDRRYELLTQGPLIQIIVSNVAASESSSTELAFSGLPSRRVTQAMIDTGAGVNCIDIGFAKKLGLQIVDTRRIASASTTSATPVFIGKIEIPELDYSVAGELFGARLSQQDRSHRLLIGRVFLSSFTLRYDGVDGAFYIGKPEYRSPSDPL